MLRIISSGKGRCYRSEFCVGSEGLSESELHFIKHFDRNEIPNFILKAKEQPAPPFPLFHGSVSESLLVQSSGNRRLLMIVPKNVLP
ncbi:hypothetical protein L596_009251 [Steinernema carpocapsae]|uniref:Uncharacterized protein n=1 Tax=Steinernema carpocapsae TaxID=34508 RepID=A0A4U5PEZ7_STECR|nr:hypothetical protein L596_009251 [Steinernema carpocapsae]